MTHRQSITPRLSAVMLAATCLTLGACTTSRHSVSDLPDAQRIYWNNLKAHCGQAFEGRVVEDSTNSPDFARTPLIMHVMTCESDRILIPFHIADDHSRTWVFTITKDGLRLKHDHRHEDGSEDEITQYGGDTRDPGTPSSQRFFADAHTADIIPAAVTNIWTVEIEPGRMYAYMLVREGTDRRFRVEFDLTRPITPPAPPWGHQ